MRAVKKAERIIKKYGGIFIRKAKHGNLYRLPDNRTLMISHTASSTGWLNQLEQRILDPEKCFVNFC